MSKIKAVKEYDNKLALYIHIPFCVSKCSYCNFCSFANKENFFKDYLKALCLEITERAKEYKSMQITTIYIGGGTPSFLPLGSITKILDCIKQDFVLDKNLSVTVEGNPNSLTYDKLLELKNNNVDRISVGLQSTKPELLKILNRSHTLKDFDNCINNAHKLGFKNINVDLIIGIPTQTLDDVKQAIKYVLEKNVQHISAYGLILEKGTPLFKKVKSGELELPDDDLCNEMYDFVNNEFKKNGFHRYEISNFSKPGFESNHNLNYWHRGQYLGFGLDAYSFVGGVHWQNPNNLENYIQNPLKKIKKEIETIRTAKFETIMLALRLDEGLDITKFNKEFNADFFEEHKDALNSLLKEKLVVIKNNHLIITNQHVSNSIIAEFA